MLNPANEVARQTGTEAQAAEIADMTGQSMADISSHLREQHLDTHAQQWSGFVLRNADFDPVALQQQIAQTPDGEVTTSSSVTRGLNSQASVNVAAAVQTYQAMGFSPEASIRAAQLVSTYSVAAQGSSQTTFEASPAQENAPQAVGTEQPVAQAEELSVDDTMAQLGEAVDQDPEISQDVRARSRLDETETLEDPLAGTEYMKEVDEETLEQPVAQQSALTMETEQTTPAADSGRLDLGFADLESQIQSSETSPAQAVDAEQENPLRFDLQLGAETQPELTPVAEAQELAPQAIAQENEVTRAIEAQVAGLEEERDAGPFRLSAGRELNRTLREGRARVGVYSVAA